MARGSNSSLPSKNQKTSTVRSFIFSRDDSNSRSTSVPEESFCMVRAGALSHIMHLTNTTMSSFNSLNKDDDTNWTVLIKEKKRHLFSDLIFFL